MSAAEKGLHPMLSALVASGNRLYAGAAIDRHEVAVATRADPALRTSADATAAELARRWNAHPALLAALEGFVAMDWRVGPSKDEYAVARAAIASAKGG